VKSKLRVNSVINSPTRILTLWKPFAKNGRARSAKTAEISPKIQSAPTATADTLFLTDEKCSTHTREVDRGFTFIFPHLDGLITAAPVCTYDIHIAVVSNIRCADEV